MTSLGRAPTLARLSAYRADPTATDPPPEEIASALRLLRGRLSNGSNSRHSSRPSTADSNSSQGRLSFAATPPSADRRPAARPQLSWSGSRLQEPTEHSPALVQHDETVRCLRDASCRCPRCVRGYEALSGECRPVLSSDRHALHTPPERPFACGRYAPVSAASVVSARTDEGAIITRLRSSEQHPRSELRCRLDTHFAAAQEVTPAPAYDAPRAAAVAPRAAVVAPAAAAVAPMPSDLRQLSDDEETLAWASDEDLDETALHEPPLRPPTTYGGFASVASGRFREAARAAAQRVAAETARMVEARRATETSSLDELRQKVAQAKEHLRQVGEETSREIAMGGARPDALLKRGPAPREASAGSTALSLATEVEAAAKAATNAAAATAMAAQLAPRLFSSSIPSNREIVPEVTAAGRYNVTLSSVLPPPSLCRQWTPANVYKEALRQKMRTAATIGLSGGKEGGYDEVDHDEAGQEEVEHDEAVQEEEDAIEGRIDGLVDAETVGGATPPPPPPPATPPPPPPPGAPPPPPSTLEPLAEPLFPPPARSKTIPLPRPDLPRPDLPRPDLEPSPKPSQPSYRGTFTPSQPSSFTSHLPRLRSAAECWGAASAWHATPHVGSAVEATATEKVAAEAPEAPEAAETAGAAGAEAAAEGMGEDEQVAVLEEESVEAASEAAGAEPSPAAWTPPRPSADWVPPKTPLASPLGSCDSPTAVLDVSAASASADRASPRDSEWEGRRRREERRRAAAEQRAAVQRFLLEEEERTAMALAPKPLAPQPAVPAAEPLSPRPAEPGAAPVQPAARPKGAPHVSTTKSVVAAVPAAPWLTTTKRGIAPVSTAAMTISMEASPTLPASRIPVARWNGGTGGAQTAPALGLGASPSASSLPRATVRRVIASSHGIPEDAAPQPAAAPAVPAATPHVPSTRERAVYRDQCVSVTLEMVRMLYELADTAADRVAAKDVAAQRVSPAVTGLHTRASTEAAAAAAAAAAAPKATPASRQMAELAIRLHAARAAVDASAREKALSTVVNKGVTKPKRWQVAAAGAIALRRSGALSPRRTSPRGSPRGSARASPRASQCFPLLAPQPAQIYSWFGAEAPGAAPAEPASEACTGAMACRGTAATTADEAQEASEDEAPTPPRAAAGMLARSTPPKAFARSMRSRFLLTRRRRRAYSVPPFVEGVAHDGTKPLDAQDAQASNADADRDEPQASTADADSEDPLFARCAASAFDEPAPAPDPAPCARAAVGAHHGAREPALTSADRRAQRDARRAEHAEASVAAHIAGQDSGAGDGTATGPRRWKRLRAALRTRLWLAGIGRSLGRTSSAESKLLLPSNIKSMGPEPLAQW